MELGDIKRKKEIILDVVQKEKWDKKIDSLRKKAGIKIDNSKKISDWDSDIIHQYQKELPRISDLALEICHSEKINLERQTKNLDFFNAIFKYILRGEIIEQDLTGDIFFEIIPNKEKLIRLGFDDSQITKDDLKPFQIGVGSDITPIDADRIFPFRIYFTPTIRQRNLIGFIKNHWALINWHQKQYEDKKRIRKKTKREIYSFIEKHKKLPAKEIKILLDKKFGDNIYTIYDIYQILYLMRKRKI